MSFGKKVLLPLPEVEVRGFSMKLPKNKAVAKGWNSIQNSPKQVDTKWMMRTDRDKTLNLSLMSAWNRRPSQSRLVLVDQNYINNLEKECELLKRENLQLDELNRKLVLEEVSPSPKMIQRHKMKEKSLLIEQYEQRMNDIKHSFALEVEDLYETISKQSCQLVTLNKRYNSLDALVQNQNRGVFQQIESLSEQVESLQQENKQLTYYIEKKSFMVEEIKRIFKDAKQKNEKLSVSFNKYLEEISTLNDSLHLYQKKYQDVDIWELHKKIMKLESDTKQLSMDNLLLKKQLWKFKSKELNFTIKSKLSSSSIQSEPDQEEKENEKDEEESFEEDEELNHMDNFGYLHVKNKEHGRHIRDDYEDYIDSRRMVRVNKLF